MASRGGRLPCLIAKDRVGGLIIRDAGCLRCDIAGFQFPMAVRPRSYICFAAGRKRPLLSKARTERDCR